MNLKEGVRPYSSLSPRAFRDNIEDEKFMDVPIKYFEFEHGRVYLDAEVASKINWSIDEEQSDIVNINAPAQEIVLDGEEISLWPGFFCSYVRKEEIKQDD